MLFVPTAGQDFGSVLSYGTTRPGTTANFGTSITPGTGAAYGTPSQVGNDLTQDCYGIWMNVNNVFAAGNYRQLALELSVDYAGGTTWTPLISGIVASQANNYAGGGLTYFFPVFIPAGAAVAVAGRSSANTTFGVAIKYMSTPPNPSMVKRASFMESIGLTLGTGTVTGVSVTPGTTNEGAWTSLGQTTNRLWWWQVACSHSDTTMTATNYHVDLAVGDTSTVGDPKDIIMSDAYIRTTASETFENQPFMFGVEKVVPAGKFIFARVQNAGANENAGSFQVVAMGCGG